MKVADANKAIVGKSQEIVTLKKQIGEQASKIEESAVKFDAVMNERNSAQMEAGRAIELVESQAQKMTALETQVQKLSENGAIEHMQVLEAQVAELRAENAQLEVAKSTANEYSDVLLRELEDHGVRVPDGDENDGVENEGVFRPAAALFEKMILPGPYGSETEGFFRPDNQANRDACETDLELCGIGSFVIGVCARCSKNKELKRCTSISGHFNSFCRPCWSEDITGCRALLEVAKESSGFKITDPGAVPFCGEESDASERSMSSASSAGTEGRKRGRPKGSKNKKAEDPKQKKKKKGVEKNYLDTNLISEIFSGKLKIESTLPEIESSSQSAAALLDEVGLWITVKEKLDISSSTDLALQLAAANAKSLASAVGISIFDIGLKKYPAVKSWAHLMEVFTNAFQASLDEIEADKVTANSARNLRSYLARFEPANRREVASCSSVALRGPAPPSQPASSTGSTIKKGQSVAPTKSGKLQQKPAPRVNFAKAVDKIMADKSYLSMDWDKLVGSTVSQADYGGALKKQMNRTMYFVKECLRGESHIVREYVEDGGTFAEAYDLVERTLAQCSPDTLRICGSELWRFKLWADANGFDFANPSSRVMYRYLSYRSEHGVTTAKSALDKLRFAQRHFGLALPPKIFGLKGLISEAKAGLEKEAFSPAEVALFEKAAARGDQTAAIVAFMVHSSLRGGHAQRTKVEISDDKEIRCSVWAGKRSGRVPFKFITPKVSVSGARWWDTFDRLIVDRKKIVGVKMDYLFAYKDHRRIPAPEISKAIRKCMSRIGITTDRTQYSARRFGPSIASLLGFSALENLSIGGWTASAQDMHGQKGLPNVYSDSRIQRSVLCRYEIVRLLKWYAIETKDDKFTNFSFTGFVHELQAKRGLVAAPTSVIAAEKTLDPSTEIAGADEVDSEDEEFEVLYRTATHRN